VFAQTAPSPARPRTRRIGAALARANLALVVFVTLAFELALAERKFAIFGGGFGQSNTIDTLGESLAFAAPLLACQALFFYVVYRLIRRLHGSRADTPLFHLNFFAIAGSAGIAVLIAKYQALAYFSDALSFQVIRNLGGGSLVEAARYSLNEASLMLAGSLAAILGYAALLFLTRRWWRGAAPLPDHNRLSGRGLAAALVATAALLFAAARVEDARFALGRFNAYIAATFVLDRATDFDGDGYSLFTWPTDTHPFDGARHPFALDVPNNGVDEDGYAGDLLLPASAEPEGPVRIAGARPHVVLVVLESTRGDALGRRVGGRPVAPNLEALAAQGSAVRGAYSHVGFTTDSMRTLFTGELAPRGPARSLFRVFRDNGYRTGAFSGQAEDFGDIAAVTGMADADIFVDATLLRDERVYPLGSASSLNVDGRALLREFDRRLGRRQAWDRPNFLYFNFQSAHFPYSYPAMDRILTDAPLERGEIGPANRERLASTYWNAVAYNDRLIGALVERLRRLGVWENTILFVTADHGESLFDDGFLGHGHMINRQQTEIPFVASRPSVAAAPVGLSDMRDIILRSAGANPGPAPGANPGNVFQLIGSLDRPSSIGTVDGHGRWTIFSFDRASLWTSADPRWRSYDSLSPAERRSADELLRLWGRQRWLARRS
jgi:glucan phosphoethanolaminetransferase (alkaline phosphatase superfamily)